MNKTTALACAFAFAVCCQVANAEQTKTVFNAFTGKPDYITTLTSTTIINQFSGCSGQQYLGADGACHQASASGGPSSLETMVNGVRVSSPTASLNLIAGTNVTLSGALAGGATAAITINATSSGGMTPGASYYWNIPSTGTFPSPYGIVTSTISATSVSISSQIYFTDVTHPYAYMNTDSIGAANQGYLHLSDYVNSETFYKIGSTIMMQGSGSIAAFAGATKAGSGSFCMGNSSCQGATSSAQRTIAIGNATLANNSSGADNICIGNNSCLSVTNSENTCIGSFACNAQANQDVAIGYLALGQETTGSNNACGGFDACELIKGGSNNSAWGQGAGDDITDGSSNTCIGGGDGNQQSCQGIATGNGNTMIGAGSGNKNTFVGSESYNTLLGYDSSAGARVNNSVALGAFAVATSSNMAVVGNPGFYGQQLTVYASTMTRYELTLGTSTAVNHVTISTTGLVNIHSLTASQCVQTDSSGNLVSSGGSCGGGGGSGGGIVSPGTFTWTNTFGMSLSTLTITTLTSQNCLGTDGSGNVQAGTCSGSGTKPPINFNFDGGGLVISSVSASVAQFYEMPYSATISSMTLSCVAASGYTVGSSTISFVVSTQTVSGFNGAVPTWKSCASDCPSFTNQARKGDGALTGWTTSLSAGDYIWADLDSTAATPQGATKCLLQLWLN